MSLNLVFGGSGMTLDERNNIVAALHALELRMTERLVKLEGLVDGHRDLRRRVTDLENACETERLNVRKLNTNLIVGMVLVGVIALGDGILKVIPMF